MVTLPYGQPIWEIEQEYLAKNVLNPNDTAMQHSNKTLQQWKTDWEEGCNHVDSQQRLDSMIQTVKKRSSIARIDFYREISLSRNAYYYALEPITNVSSMIWNNNYHKANVLNSGKGHCLYFVLYQAMNDIDGNKITVAMANSVRKLLRQHLSEQLIVACIRNTTVANSILGEFYSAFYETPTLQQLRTDHATDLEARFGRSPLSNILNEIDRLLDHGAATFDEFMPVPVKVYWILLWHKLMMYVDYWGGGA
jgi:hypothetical protein